MKEVQLSRMTKGTNKTWWGEETMRDDTLTYIRDTYKSFKNTCF